MPNLAPKLRLSPRLSSSFAPFLRTSTNAGWREEYEVRGWLSTRTVSREIRSSVEYTQIANVHAEWYLDQLGKVQALPSPHICHVANPILDGLVARYHDRDRIPQGHRRAPMYDTCPPFERDTLNIYLIGSRDGVHVDHEWVYAHQPLITRKDCSRATTTRGCSFLADLSSPENTSTVSTTRREAFIMKSGTTIGSVVRF